MTELDNEISEYFESLVLRLPLWIRRLFDTELLVFALDDNGNLEVMVDKSIPKKRLGKINRKISEYLDSHDAPFLKRVNIH